MMRHARLYGIVVLVCILVTLPTARASAEWFIDIYAGNAFSQDEEVTLRYLGTAFAESDFDHSFTTGGRVGYYFHDFPSFGLALDASYFKPDFRSGDFNIVPVTADVVMVPISVLTMIRFPLVRSRQHHEGMVQPYVAVGPGLFITDIEFDLTNVGKPGVERYHKFSADIGLDSRGGVAFMLTEHVAIFTEYRFTHVHKEFESSIDNVKMTLETDFNTHSVLGGISYRF